MSDVEQRYLEDFLAFSLSLSLFLFLNADNRISRSICTQNRNKRMRYSSTTFKSKEKRERRKKGKRREKKICFSIAKSRVLRVKRHRESKSLVCKSLHIRLVSYFIKEFISSTTSK